MVYQLIYTSRMQSGIDESVIKNIAHLSAGRNQAWDVTGLLISSGKLILQFLEGEEEDVRAVYDRLCRDTRHYDVALLCESESDRREFPGQHMAFKSFDCDAKHQNLNALIDSIYTRYDMGEHRMFA